MHPDALPTNTVFHNHHHHHHHGDGIDKDEDGDGGASGDVMILVVRESRATVVKMCHRTE